MDTSGQVRRRVLFVDDEPRILEGLQRMLRPQRAAIETLIAPGGAEALELLARERVDAVVSDMRMPRMDGAQLLAEVRERHPSAVRIILSGQSDLETILRAVGTTHQFLAKPCDPQMLLRTVSSACANRDRLGDPGLQARVSRLATVDALPRTHRRLAADLVGEESALRRAAATVAADPGMAAKVLQLVSSTFFGQPRRVAGPEEAARLLGLDILRALAGSAGAFAPALIEDQGHAAAAAAALDAAAGARAAAALLGADQRESDDAAMAGLLHGIGSLALGPDASTGASTPAGAGAALLGLWGIPEPVVEAVAHQAEPSWCPEPGRRVAGALHAALAAAGTLPWDEGWIADAGGEAMRRSLADAVERSRG